MKTSNKSSILEFAVLLLIIATLFSGCAEEVVKINPEKKYIEQNQLSHKQIDSKYKFNQFGPVVYRIAEPEKLDIPQFVKIKSSETTKGRQYVYHAYPTGDPYQDWETIQSIVNMAGENNMNVKIMLKATNVEGEPTPFNLGTGFGLENPDTYAVTIWGAAHGHNGNVEFIGESGNSYQTTITGGITYDPFGEIRIESFAFQVLDRNSVIFRNIRFENNAAILSGNSEYYFTTMPTVGTLKVINCTFSDMVGSPILIKGTTEQAIIKDCSFFDYGWEIGIFLNQPDFQFKNNTINSTGNGYGLSLWQVNGNLTIKGNTIYSRTGDYIFYSNTGIYLGARDVSNVEIIDNDINTDGAGFISNDVAGPQTNHVLIRDNEITIEEPVEFAPVAIGIYSYYSEELSGFHIADNVITGSGFWAIEFSSASTFYPEYYTPGDIHHNSIVNNDVSGFDPTCLGFPIELINLASCPTVYLDPSTRDNIYCGDTEILADQGDNLINSGNCSGRLTTSVTD